MLQVAVTHSLAATQLLQEGRRQCFLLLLQAGSGRRLLQQLLLLLLLLMQAGVLLQCLRLHSEAGALPTT